mmetsp:Transcript_28410/g.50566  ORF Transcript_28410/g.50566 Transcript_28410/m.50566 type:complete len:300 (-) Transcript_28410:434-1333(-)
MEAPHTIQCRCDISNYNILVRGYLSVFNSEKTQSCKRARKWLERCRIKQASVEVYTAILETPVDCQTFMMSQHQIDLDLLRTYPDEEYFSGQGKAALRRVLLALAKYDPSLGYVQGMNFIVAALLWHSTEAEAFWLMVSLMEDYELRDNYMPGLPGLTKHSQIIELLTFETMPKLHRLFAQYRVQPDMYLTEWVISLFGSLLTVHDMTYLLDQFFAQGWLFFYKLVLLIFLKLQPKLLASQEFVDILVSLKPIKRTQKDIAQFVNSMQGKLTWAALITQALEVRIDAAYIHNILPHLPS